MLPRNHELSRIGQHVYWYSPDGRTDRPILGAIVGERATLMVDAGASADHARSFLNALKEAAVPAPAYLALTHWHWDHIFGMSELSVPLVTHAGTAAELAVLSGYSWDDAALNERVAAGSEIPFCRDMIQAELPGKRRIKLRKPDIVFTSQLTINLGGVSCELHHVGGDHAEDSTVIYVPEDRALFLGDCLYQRLYSPQPHYSADKLLPLLDKLATLPAETYLEGHNDTLLNQADYAAFTAALRAGAELAQQFGPNREAIQAGVQKACPEMAADEVEELATFFANGAS
ncbi:MAG: MBL fold metallo-hydrolase [Anaerolineales bacterium]|nr:MBL fold metallo-hydrolase [Anaerolineales bacterium]